MKHTKQAREGQAGATVPALGKDAKYNSAPVRAERFALQSVSRILLPKDRVRHCCLSRQSGQSVSVWRSVAHRKAHYKGLQTCGSVWVCPVCAAKIAERRRAELLAGIESHKATGGQVLFLTLTNSHDRGDRLADLLDGQKKALTRFNSDRASRALWGALGVVGQVRALEVTHGHLSGWHPHYHILIFVRGSHPARVLAWFRDQFAARWQECCRAAGLPLPDLAHGCTLQLGDYAAKYAAKWGAAEEMTRSHTKKARAGSSPFDLLRAVFATGDCEPASLFQEYARAFKGKRQLHWSRGLKSLLGVADMTDEEIASAAVDDSEHLANLTVEQWRAVVRTDSRAALLAAAEESFSSFVLFLARLLDCPPAGLLYVVQGEPD